MRDIDAQHADCSREGGERQAGDDHPMRTEARNQPPGKEARRVHRDDVPLNAEVGRRL